MKEENFSGVEIKCEFGVIDPEKIESKEIKNLKEILNSLELQPSIHATFIDINIASFHSSIRKASIKRIQSCLNLASKLDAKWVTVHCGHFLPTPLATLESALKMSLNSLKEIASKAEELDLKIGLENKECTRNYRNIFINAEEGLWLLENIEKDCVGFIFDFGHANICKNNLADFYRKLKEKLIAVHVHDNNGNFDQHLPVGQGTINFEQILKIKTPENIVIECDEEKQIITSKNAIEKIVNLL
ncbi:MAG: sugar phosphate isomerase/epimerase family protein [Candidatus Hodarchaeota archaeon]